MSESTPGSKTKAGDVLSTIPRLLCPSSGSWTLHSQEKWGWQVFCLDSKDESMEKNQSDKWHHWYRWHIQMPFISTGCRMLPSQGSSYIVSSSISLLCDQISELEPTYSFLGLQVSSRVTASGVLLAFLWGQPKLLPLGRKTALLIQSWSFTSLTFFQSLCCWFCLSSICPHVG